MVKSGSSRICFTNPAKSGCGRISQKRIRYSPNWYTVILPYMYKMSYLGKYYWHWSEPIQYEHAPLRMRCAMLRKHPPVDPILSCLSCFRKPSVGVCQVISNSPDPWIAWPSTRFRPDLWRWFEEDTASIRWLKQREATTRALEVIFVMICTV